MSNWPMIFVGFTFGMWAGLAAFINFYNWSDKRAAKSGFIEINDVIYRIERLKAPE